MKVNSYKDRIIVNPEIMLGKSIIKCTRITVELILSKLSGGINYTLNYLSEK